MSTAPWMTALEMQFGTLGACHKLFGQDAPRSVTDAHVLHELPTASPFAWSKETAAAVWLASKSIPLSAQFERDLLPDGIRNAFWWLEYSLPLPMKNPPPLTSEEYLFDIDNICSILLSRDPEGWWVISCGRMSSFGLPLMIEVNQIAPGTSLRHLMNRGSRMMDSERGTFAPIRDRDISLLRFIMAASVWLKQRIVTIGSGHIERHRRKQIMREYGVMPSDVKVIQLRRAESDYSEGPTSAQHVDWSCRWIVNGHWRNQPYKDEHKLIYINPYVKGPEDLPLKVPAHTVYAVNR